MRTALLRMVMVTAGLFAAWFSTAALAVDASPVFRFYNTRTGTHFYTISGAERDTVLNNYPQFAYEGAVFWAWMVSNARTYHWNSGLKSRLEPAGQSSSRPAGQAEEGLFAGEAWFAPA